MKRSELMWRRQSSGKTATAATPTCTCGEAQAEAAPCVSGRRSGGITFLTMIRPPAHAKKQYKAITAEKTLPALGPR